MGRRRQVDTPCHRWDNRRIKGLRAGRKGDTARVQSSDSQGETGDGQRREATTPVVRVAEIPLFPLNLVLFPHMQLPLHIFEERYKEMVNRCVRESLPFGIVLATGTSAITGNVETSNVGCTARISRVERLPDGCMNIEVVGERRFRILDTHEQQSYRTGVIEAFEDTAADPTATLTMAIEVRQLLHEFLSRMLTSRGETVPEFDLPDQPEHLSFTAAWALLMDNDKKQALLSAPDTADRLATEREILQGEVTRLRRAEAARETVWTPVKAAGLGGYLSEN